MTQTISSLEDLNVFAKGVVDSLQSNTEHATLILLKGNLGAGKTALTKSVAHELGVEEHVTSPTFVLAKEYPLTDQKFKTLIHIDAYRLEGEESLAPLNFEEMLKDPNNLIFLEWPERVQDALPDWAKEIQIEVVGEDRVIRYEKT